MELQYDETLLNFVSNINLRRYKEVLQGGRPIVQVRTRDEATGEVATNRTVYDMDVSLAQNNMAYTLGSMGGIMVGQCRLTLG